MKKDKFIIKDSGKREKYESGMVRDVQDDKPRYDLIYFPLLKDWADLMSGGAKKYGERNWEKSNSIEELNRFKASAFRHFVQFMSGEEDESHHSAVLFNIGAIRYLQDKLNVDINGNKRK
jgi:hypothetical protein